MKFLHSIKKVVAIYPWWAGVLVLIAGSLVYAGLHDGNGDIKTTVLHTQNFVRNVSIAGKVIPSNDVELGFDAGGRIAAVYKEVGDTVYAGQVLAVLSSGDVAADVAKAEADLDAERARLSELKNGTVGILGTELRNAEKELSEAAYDAYVRTDDAIRNNVDQFYDDSKIVFAFNDYELKQELDKKRKEVGYLLDEWTDNSFDAKIAETNLIVIKSFLDRIALAVNDFKVEGSPYSQTEIDKFKNDVSSARTSINLASSNLIKAREGIRSVESEIPYQEAKVKAAEATVQSYKAELGKKTITAPFSGVITIQNAKVGKIANANDSLITLISKNAFQIETFVPEINISEVKVGNVAKVTLDAYGDAEFEAKVVSIDPGETIRDGVATYKVTFEFTKEDSRLKPGLTANVIITTSLKENSILMPQDALVKKNGFTNVYVKAGDEFVLKQITTGAVSANGDIEVVAGLEAGEILVLEPDKVTE